jgi:hypothetical protein
VAPLSLCPHRRHRLTMSWLPIAARQSRERLRLKSHIVIADSSHLAAAVLSASVGQFPCDPKDIRRIYALPVIRWNFVENLSRIATSTSFKYRVPSNGLHHSTSKSLKQNFFGDPRGRGISCV